MQLQNHDACCSVKDFLWVNFTLEDKTPLAFQQEKRSEWLKLDMSEMFCVSFRRSFWAPECGRQLCAGHSCFYRYLSALPSLILWQSFISCLMCGSIAASLSKETVCFRLLLKQSIWSCEVATSSCFAIYYLELGTKCLPPTSAASERTGLCGHSLLTLQEQFLLTNYTYHSR